MKRKRKKVSLSEPQVPGIARLEAIYADLMRRPNVVGCFVGRKRTKGAATDDLSIVCVVREKPRKRDLNPESELLPRRVSWKRSSRRNASIKTDVQVGDERFQSASISGPGDEVRLIGVVGGSATVGVAIQHPIWGPVVTTAGHFLLPGTTGDVTYSEEQRPRVRLAAATNTAPFIEGVALKARVDDIADYAIIKPDSASDCQNLYRDANPLAAPYLPSPGDIGTGLYVLSASGIRRARFRGLFGMLPAGNAGAMRNLLVTQFATGGGDSGSVLIDRQSRVWGLLVGVSYIEQMPYSVFMSCVVPLHFEGAVFI